MNVYVLTTKKPDYFNDKHTSFIFKSKSDADVFLYVFKDHWCHVKFYSEYQDRMLTHNELKLIEENPKDRAEQALEWGFLFAKFHGDDKTTLAEKRFIEKMININN